MQRFPSQPCQSYKASDSSRHSSNSTPCIERYVASTNALISATQLDTVNTYFAKNNLSTTGLQFTSQVPIAHSVPVHPSVPYDDTCLLGQLGYVDASILHTGIPFNTLLLKAWIVYPASQNSNANPYTYIYPCVTVIDSTGQAIADTLILY